jgi:hypothetical protein
MTLSKLIRLKMEFEAMHGRKPLYVALSVEEFQQIKASLYLPGIRGMRLHDFKTGKVRLLGMQLIWRDNVLC